MKFKTGIPPIEQVAEHERDFPGAITRTDGIRLGDINVGRESKPGGERVKVDNEESYGQWLCIDRYSAHFGAVPSLLRLRVVNDEILMAVGFCSWLPLVECSWAERASYMPVTAKGLPTDYEESYENERDI